MAPADERWDLGFITQYAPPPSLVAAIRDPSIAKRSGAGRRPSRIRASSGLRRARLFIGFG
jgi:hypothetical protein